MRPDDYISEESAFIYIDESRRFYVNFTDLWPVVQMPTGIQIRTLADLEAMIDALHRLRPVLERVKSLNAERHTPSLLKAYGLTD